MWPVGLVTGGLRGLLNVTSVVSECDRPVWSASCGLRGPQNLTSRVSKRDLGGRQCMDL